MAWVSCRHRGEPCCQYLPILVAGRPPLLGRPMCSSMGEIVVSMRVPHLAWAQHLLAHMDSEMLVSVPSSAGVCAFELSHHVCGHYS